MTDATALRRAAERAQSDPFFLAGLLQRYREEELLDESALADFLGCRPEDLPRLALCRRPGDGAAFRRDISILAQRFRLHERALIRLVRVAESLEGMANEGGLLAARDRESAAGTESPS